MIPTHLLNYIKKNSKYKYISEMNCLLIILDINSICERNTFFELDCKILKLNQIMDKKRHIGTNVLIRYSAYLLFGQTQINKLYSKLGKPYLKNSRLYFNVSHSGENSIIGISFNKKNIGVDIEEITNINTNIASKCLSNKEYKWFSETKYNQKELLCKIWTIKESYIKAAGLGLQLLLKTVLIRKIYDPFFVVENDKYGTKIVYCFKYNNYYISLCTQMKETNDGKLY